MNSSEIMHLVAKIERINEIIHLLIMFLSQVNTESMHQLKLAYKLGTLCNL